MVRGHTHYDFSSWTWWQEVTCDIKFRLRGSIMAEPIEKTLGQSDEEWQAATETKIKLQYYGKINQAESILTL